METDWVKIEYVNNPNALESKIEELKKTQVGDKFIHEIKNELSKDCAGEFEVFGKISIGNQIRDAHIGLRFITEYEHYVNAIDGRCDAEDAIFNGYLYKISSPQFTLVIKGQYGNGCAFKHEFIENRGNNCYIPTKGYCFIKCISYITGEENKQHYLDFIRKEKKRPNNMNTALIQSCLKTFGIEFGSYNEKEIYPRSICQRGVGLRLYNNYFCLIWKSEGVSFNQAVEELERLFKIVDQFITEGNVNSQFKYEFIRKKLNLIWLIL